MAPTPAQPPENGGLLALIYVLLMVIVIIWVMNRLGGLDKIGEPRSRRERITRSPGLTLRDTPVTSCMMLAVAAFSTWMGYVILTVTVDLPAERRLASYQGPLAVFDLHVWGWLFLAGGLCGVLRLFAFGSPRVDLVLHLCKMVPIVGWAVCFDFGPSTTAQPGYTFVAFVSVTSSMSITLVERRYGAVRPSIFGTREH